MLLVDIPKGRKTHFPLYPIAQSKMKYFEAFQLMAQYARQLLLSSFIEEFIAFLKEYEGYCFFEIVSTLSIYAMSHQSNPHEQIKRNWEIVGRQLAHIATESEKISRDEPGKEQQALPSNLDALQSSAKLLRKDLLLQMLELWLEVLESERYHFGDLLEALANYAQDKAGNNDSDHDWEIIASLLKIAAQSAREEGNELP